MKRYDENGAFMTPTKRKRQSYGQTSPPEATNQPNEQESLPHASHDVNEFQQMQLRFCAENAMDMVTVSGRISERCYNALDAPMVPATETQALGGDPMQTETPTPTIQGRTATHSAEAKNTKSNTRESAPKRKTGWWRELMQSPLGLVTPPSQKKAPRLRKYIPCDEVKPASARKPHIEGLEYETPVHEGPFLLKPRRLDLNRSPRKVTAEATWTEGPPVLLDHAWRKGMRRENPTEYRKTKRFIANTRGAPPLSSPSHSSLGEAKSPPKTKFAQHQRDLAEALNLENDVKEKIATPYTHFDDTHWA